ncbi:MAG: hypothetical protein IPL52_05930 [Flavobacteriales bacterium]|nr:hypothetical protein [Flavobacteriales bacterium]
MHYAIRAVLVLMGSCAAGPMVLAQIDTVSVGFRSISIHEGLSQGMVTWIMQDRYGFMWFATKDGLNRYDGYSFKVYRHDPSDSTSVRNSFITSITEDRRGRLWVGTSTGLDLFDQERESFTHFPCTDGDPLPTGPSKVFNGCGCQEISEDLAGNIWVATNQGLNRLALPRSGIPDAAAVTITVVISATDWTYASIDRAGVLRGHVKDQYAFAVDTREPDPRVVRIGLDRPDKYISEGQAFSRTNLLVLEDTVRDRIYGVHPYGVVQIDPRTNTATTLREFPEMKVLMMPYRIAVDANGALWLPSQGGRMLRFDPGNGNLASIRTDASDILPILEFVKCTYRDRNGLLWFGTSGYGLLTYDPRVERFHPVPGASVRYMAAARDGQLLLNESNFFFTLYNPSRQRRTFVMDERTVRQRHKVDWYSGSDALAEDRNGILWLNKGGLVAYDRRTGSLQRHAPPATVDGPGDPNATCFPFKLLGDTLWFANQLFQWFHVGSRTFGSYPFPIAPRSDPYSFVQSIHLDARGIFWLGTVSGLLRFDRRTGRWDHYTHDPSDAATLGVNVIFSLADDPAEPDRFLWIGTNGGGLDRLEKATGRVKRFTVNDGLPNDVVYGILDDEDGNLWMSTNKGIACFTPSTGAFRNFDAGDGLQDDEFNRDAYCKLPDGTLCFGGVKGFNFFRPRELVEDSTAHVIRITAIKLSNAEIDHRTPGSPLSVPAHLASGMRIPYSANMITFEFATLEYAAPKEHRYQYKLDGFDPDWVMADRSRAATYTNLDPGTYTFRVRGENRDGIWDPQGTSFMLEVLPPWWRTWWFYTICGIILIGGVLSYIINLERTVRLRSRELAEEKERSDALLRNILPEEVAQELKDTGTAEARHYDQATILFAEIVGLAEAVDRDGARELVDELNTCFKAFDRIIAARGSRRSRPSATPTSAPAACPTRGPHRPPMWCMRRWRCRTSWPGACLRAKPPDCRHSAFGWVSTRGPWWPASSA